MADGLYIEVGRLISTFGISGEMKVLFDLEIPDDELDEKGFKYIEAFFIHKNSQFIPYFIEYIADPNGEKPKVKFEDINSKEEAQELIGKSIYLPEDLLEIEEDSGEFGHIIGYLAHDSNLGSLGIIETVYQLPMQELAAIVIKGKEVLIPLNTSTLLSVDSKKKKVNLSLPEGLVDIYLENEN